MKSIRIHPKAVRVDGISTSEMSRRALASNISTPGPTFSLTYVFMGKDTIREGQTLLHKLPFLRFAVGLISHITVGDRYMSIGHGVEEHVRVNDVHPV